MKTFIHGMVMIAIGIFIVLSIYTIFISANMKKQLTNAMSTAVDSAVWQATLGKAYTINDSEEFKYEFLQDLCMQTEGEGDIRVDFNHVDYDEGLLGVTVTKEFQYPIGTTGRVKCSKIVILEEEIMDEKLYTLNFYDSADKLYRAYKGYLNQVIVIPPGNWKNTSNNRSVSGEITITGDMDFKCSEEIL